MTVPPCQRKWQVEAVRDGQLRGKDRDSSLRHRAICAECRREDRALSALGHDMARLPELARDPMTTRRSRQRLIAALDRSVLEPALSVSFSRAACALALAAIVVGGFAIERALTRPNATEDPESVVEVRAEAGARWSEWINQELDRVDLSEGTAAFNVHPHKLRRVVIQLPDGQVEDIGTVFEIRVKDQHTRHISVSQGRVAVRMRGRLPFTLGAGEAWESGSAAAPETDAQNQGVRISGTPPNAQPLAVATTAPSAASRPNQVAARARTLTPPEKGSTLASPPASSRPEPRIENSGSDGAEDDAYLQILESLKRENPADARARAKDYLLRFPNGFRRVEVLNIAMRRSDDASDAPRSVR